MTEELVEGEDALGALDPFFDRGSEELLAKLGDEAARGALREDVRAAGLFGVVAALAAAAPPDPSVRDEAPSALEAELSRVVAPAAASPGARLAAWAATKPTRGHDLARRLAARVLFDLFSLSAHGLFQDDLLRAGDLLARSRAGRDARVLAQRLARVSKTCAQVVLGHIPDQLVMIHRIAAEDVAPGEVEKALGEFAPRVYAVRLPSILRTLLPNEPKLRLALVLWGRLRGVVLGKDRLSGALAAAVPERPETVLALVSAGDSRERLRELAALERGEDGARARGIEDALLAE